MSSGIIAFNDGAGSDLRFKTGAYDVASISPMTFRNIDFGSGVVVNATNEQKDD